MKDRCARRYNLVILAILVIAGHAPAAYARDVALSNTYWEIRVSAGTLRTQATPKGRATMELSAAQTGLGPVADLEQTDQTAQWKLPDQGLIIAVEFHERDLHVQIRSNGEGTFTWPILKQQTPFEALIWPRAEGAYIPLDNTRWMSYLIEHGDWDTLASLSMPFWGFDCGDFTLTYIATCPYNNAIRFSREQDTLRASFTHEFTRFQKPKEYGFVISLNENNSPVEPAKRFRRWLVKNGRFVSMQEKMKKIPKAERLLGAAHVYLWGDGVSTKMLKRFKDAGFDRLRLCVSGWEGVEKRPHIAERANDMGYLFGTYDSFHSIHDPALQGTDDTWPTAQFDEALFDRGRILRKDGTPRGGFKGVGVKLSPIAARPAVEERVRRNMKNVPYSYYFVDCDAYGEVYDDYSPLHPAGQADDAAARADRLRWIGETFGVPIGSEGGCFRFAGVIHVSEGIFGPLFGWGDPDMRDRNSEYFLGGYYPPDGPRIFTQQVPIKEKYEFLCYDPRFRLPLYETVFHDSVVTTHHWQNASLKFENIAETVALTELLYMASPLYHMNLDEFEKHQKAMKRQYDCFSPLHRELGFAQMTDFDWLSADRLLQRTVFVDGVELVANFAPDARRYAGVDIPNKSVMVRWKDSGKMRLLTPVAGNLQIESQ